MVTDAQVRKLRAKLMAGLTQEAAAAAASMSERSARKWRDGPLPSETKKPRGWRTRADRFSKVWESEVVPLLREHHKGVLEARTILLDLEKRRPGEFGERHRRTLQRRMREWRALEGPPKEVYFEQEHVPGREAAIDFTHATDLGVTVGGALLVHLLFELVLVFSKWTWVQVAFGETFEAVASGVQGALWELGGVTEVVRSDNRSAATHELREGGRGLTRRYGALLEHYGARSTRIRPGESHENGAVEQRHRRTKSLVEQALVLRGHRDFASVDEYQTFVRSVLVEHHTARLDPERLCRERAALRPLPAAPVPGHSNIVAKVRKWSTMRVRERAYSVPSRLIGHEVKVRLHADVVEVLVGDKVVETMPRIHGKRTARIDYRHVIWSLVKKPGAFARYRHREELVPSLTFRRAYDALRERHGERADVEYVRLLHLAASTMEATVEAALTKLLEERRPVDHAAVRALATPATTDVPELRIPPPDLAAYDGLLTAAGAS